MAPRPPAAPWSYVVGLIPHKVQAVEDTARKGVIYLRWRAGGRAHVKSTGLKARDSKGRLDRTATQAAQAEAAAQYDRLVRGIEAPTTPPAAVLTIADGWAMAIDLEKGKWPARTPHRDEMQRALDRAQATWGATATWASIGRGELRQLWRRELAAQRAKGHRGVRSAQIVLARVLTVADWLRNEQHIGPLACTRWPSWKVELAKDAGEYEPKRPRYTADEYRRYLKHAAAVDPRWGLLISFGAELRVGQVARVRRSDVDAGAGRVQIRGAGNKRGTLVVLTAGQRALLTHTLQAGYLAGLEAARMDETVEDYPLFPGGHLPADADGLPVTEARHATRAPLERTVMRVWHHQTEEAASIPHLQGRGWYALRRAAVDLAKSFGISREGLQASGGWTNAQVPDAIYADQQQAYASEEAARVRAQMRGEVDGPLDPKSTPTTRQNATRPADERGAPEDSTDAK